MTSLQIGFGVQFFGVIVRTGRKPSSGSKSSNFPGRNRIEDVRVQKTANGQEAGSVRRSPTNYSIATGKRLRDFAGAVDEALHHRARRAILQCYDSDRRARDRQIDRQFL